MNVIMVVSLLVPATPLPAVTAGLPPLHNLDRFPAADAIDARIRTLVYQRLGIRNNGALSAEEQHRALERIGHALACWEVLHEARGGLAEEDGGRNDDVTRRKALERLRGLLGFDAWNAGTMP